MNQNHREREKYLLALEQLRSAEENVTHFVVGECFALHDHQIEHFRHEQAAQVRLVGYDVWIVKGSAFLENGRFCESIERRAYTESKPCF